MDTVQTFRSTLNEKTLSSILKNEYQPGGVGIYLVVEYFEGFWGIK
jgi:hypothetical protein